MPNWSGGACDYIRVRYIRRSACLERRTEKPLRSVCGMNVTQDQLSTAVEANLFGWLSNYGRGQDSALQSDDELALFYTGAPLPLLNGAFRARIRKGAADERIQSVTREFDLRGVPFAWWLGPSAEPTDLARRLRRHGFLHLGKAQGMAARLQDIRWENPASRFTVRRVQTAEDLVSWSETLSRSFSLTDRESKAWREVHRRIGLDEDSPLRHYLVFSEQRAVSTASTFLKDGVVGLYHVGTVPEARREGLARTATIHALSDARDTGCRIAILQSSKLGVRLYERLGFRMTSIFDVYTHRHEVTV